jgi:hypothetical protein
MLKVYAGGVLMVLGMAALVAQPVAGVVMIGGGYWLFTQSSSWDRHHAQSVFFGMALLCLAVVGVAALL